MDTTQLFSIHKKDSFFVVREKRKMKYVVETDCEYNNPETGIMADQYILFKGKDTKKQYPETIRRVVFYDKSTNKTFVFYTNNTKITAEDVALLYKNRWRVE